jgi:hypothetical protein
MPHGELTAACEALNALALEARSACPTKAGQQRSEMLDTETSATVADDQ